MYTSDPDELALLVVQQFLKEKNYSRALQEIECAEGLKFVESKLPRGSMLLELIYGYMEREAAGDHSATEEQAEEERLLQGGNDDFPSETLQTISGVYKSNLTAVCCIPGRDIVVTGTGDGTVMAVRFTGEEVWAERLGHGGAISLALSPFSQEGNSRLIVGSMDGTVWLLECDSGHVLHSEKAHAKYVVRVCWAPDAHHFLSASRDGSIAVFSLAGDRGADSSRVQAGTAFKKLKSLPFPAAVQDVVVLPGGERVVVAVRDTNYLRLRKFPNIEDAEESVNMNPSGDDHVSFSASQLCVSPDGTYLLVSTDGPRILLLRISGWVHARTQIFGLPMAPFHTPVALWHDSGFYVMAAAAAGQIVVFHVGTGKVVASLKAHEKNVRWMDYDPRRNLLLSCSFDRTVKIIGRAPGQPMGVRV